MLCRTCGARVKNGIPFCTQCGQSFSTRKRERMYPSRAPAQMCGLDQVSQDRLPSNLARKFREVLDEADDEKPLQLFFEKHPTILLTSIVCHRTSWIFPRKSLPKPEGGSWVPDFMICDWTSVGPLWTILELESPTAKATNSRGISGKCRHAIQQIEDYRSHLRKHAVFLRDGGLFGIHGKCHAWIVIGRTEERSIADCERLANLREYDIEVASYDRFLKNCEETIRSQQSSRRWWKKLKSQVPFQPVRPEQRS
jgi:Domain of unknown function (DUF4263)